MRSGTTLRDAVLATITGLLASIVVALLVIATALNHDTPTPKATHPHSVQSLHIQGSASPRPTTDPFVVSDAPIPFSAPVPSRPAVDPTPRSTKVPAVTGPPAKATASPTPHPTSTPTPSTLCVLAICLP